jgi:hypothetical protein
MFAAPQWAAGVCGWDAGVACESEPSALDGLLMSDLETADDADRVLAEVAEQEKAGEAPFPIMRGLGLAPALAQ